MAPELLSPYDAIIVEPSALTAWHPMQVLPPATIVAGDPNASFMTAPLPLSCAAAAAPSPPGSTPSPASGASTGASGPKDESPAPPASDPGPPLAPSTLASRLPRPFSDPPPSSRELHAAAATHPSARAAVS